MGVCCAAEDTGPMEHMPTDLTAKRPHLFGVHTADTSSDDEDFTLDGRLTVWEGLWQMRLPWSVYNFVLTILVDNLCV